MNIKKYFQILIVVLIVLYFHAVSFTISSQVGHDKITTPYRPYSVVNGLDAPGADSIVFRKFQSVTGDENYYPIRLLRDNERAIPFGFNIFNFEQVTDIFYVGDEGLVSFDTRAVRRSKDTVVRIYWYPAYPPLPESFFLDPDKKKKVAGKIVVYEMSEIDAK